MIRVQRLLEYNYDSFEVMEEDMLRWQIPAFGSHRISDQKIIYSACLPPMTDLMKENDKPN